MKDEKEPKENISKVIFYTGFLNVIIVIGSLFSVFLPPHNIPNKNNFVLYSLYYIRELFLYYSLFGSFIPPIFCLIATSNIAKKYKTINIIINVIFLVIYISCFMFFSYITKYA